MRYQNIIPARFISRPNRFIARVEMDGAEETVHVKNTGRCRELLLPGALVYLERSQNPNRKTAYDLVGVYKEGLGLVNMDSQAPNEVVKEWLIRQKSGEASPGLSFFERLGAIKPEFTWGQSRIDFYFEAEERKCLMEVKGVTLERERIAYFPDAPTERGVKHIEELEKAQREGYDCFLGFVIQMPGIRQIQPNDETHPAFGEALRRASRAGVRVLALGCRMEKDGMDIVSVDEMHY